MYALRRRHHLRNRSTNMMLQAMEQSITNFLPQEVIKQEKTL